MIFKKRTMPKKLQGLLALEKRLSPNYHNLKSIQSEIYNRKAGFGGEQQFDRKMAEFQPSYPHALLQGICLKHKSVFFEMDAILITPAFIIIFEVKNISEKLIISSNPTQFIKESSDGTRKGMTSPVAELERKEFHLKEWLSEQKISIPISKVVVFAYSNELTITNIKGTKITFAYELPAYLRTLTIDKSTLSKTQIKNLASKLTLHHDDYNPYPLAATMKIPHVEIQPGIICPNCFHIGMQWATQKWNCSNCTHKGITEHQDAVKDWFMLLNNQMTNNQFRYFTMTPNRYTARRLLVNSNLELKGNRKAAYYIMKEDNPFQ